MIVLLFVAFVMKALVPFRVKGGGLHSSFLAFLMNNG